LINATVFILGVKITPHNSLSDYGHHDENDAQHHTRLHDGELHACCNPEQQHVQWEIDCCADGCVND